MHRTVFRPSPERLSKVIEDNASQTPERDQAHVGHDGRNIASLINPRRDEFRETVSPDVLVDRHGDHERAGNRLVRVDRVGGGDGGDGRDLDSGTRVANNDDCFPWPSSIR